MNSDFSLRPATEADTPAVFRLFLRSVRDLAYRQGTRAAADGDNPDVIAAVWEQRQSMFEHLARSAHQFWLAERDGEILGYARSILRDGMLELTEFFVSPEAQSGGIGRQLLARVFAGENVRFRTIIASTDTRAQARYLKAGVYPLFPIYHLVRKAEVADVMSDLRFESLQLSEAVLETLGELDAAILGYRRDVDHRWFLDNRDGYLIYRDGCLLGYGYASRGSGGGPYVLLDSADYPAVLTQAETLAARNGQEEIAFGVPMVNRAAVTFLLRRGYRIDPSILLYMSDSDAPWLDRYIVTGPPFFL